VDVWVDSRYCQGCKQLYVVACDCPPVPYRKCSVCHRVLYYSPRKNTSVCPGGCDGG
jgi:hypothetical protein